MGERLAVIGGDAAGMSAASQARRRVPDPEDLEIVAFERTRFTSYSACGIPYFVSDIVPEVDKLIARSPDEHRRRGIDVRIEHEVTSVDLERRALRVRALDDGTERDHGFDRLVIATGATPVRPSLDGIDADGVFGVQTLADGIAVRRAVDETEPRTAVVIGGGYIGLELAEALVRRGLEVSLVERESQPMATLDPDMGALVADALRGVGVRVRLEEPVEGFEVAGGRVKAVVTGDRTLPADLVILGLGVRPATDLAAAAGIEVGDSGGIVTDLHMRASAEHVWAAGDCVETVHRVSGRRVVIALGTHANKQGRVVGTNVTGGDATFPGVIGTAVSRICDYEVSRTGLSEGEAADAGFDAVGATIDSTTRAGYYPDAQPIRVKLVAERAGGRLLGGQIVGKEGAAKRIDVIATAAWNEMAVQEVAMLDLSYAPPFSPVWDPVLIAARTAADLVE